MAPDAGEIWPGQRLFGFWSRRFYRGLCQCRIRAAGDLRGAKSVTRAPRPLQQNPGCPGADAAAAVHLAGVLRSLPVVRIAAARVELATALYATFLRGGGFPWALEFIRRLLLMPNGVVERRIFASADTAHRGADHVCCAWKRAFPGRGADDFLPAQLDARDVGESPGALVLLVVLLLSMAQFFRLLLPAFLRQGADHAGV